VSSPTPPQSTPIRITGLPFSVRLDAEGTMSVRLIAWDALVRH
jgi:hypothetical protein